MNAFLNSVAKLRPPTCVTVGCETVMLVGFRGKSIRVSLGVRCVWVGHVSMEGRGLFDMNEIPLLIVK